MDDNYALLFEAMKNPTKMKIITLLINYDKLNATEMAKFIKTTRSNIYQNISFLASNGIINNSDTVVKKNYIEKYYSLNREFFMSTSTGMEERLSNVDNSQFKDIAVSFFLAQSLNLLLIAEQVKNLPDTEIETIKKQMEKEIAIAYGTLSHKSSIKLVKNLKKGLSDSDDGGDEDTMFLFVIFPELKELFKMNNK
ncbi:MAG: winged helix-turn-helix domain-containing protein [Ferroplasma sp.]